MVDDMILRFTPFEVLKSVIEQNEDINSQDYEAVFYILVQQIVELEKRIKLLEQKNG